MNRSDLRQIAKLRLKEAKALLDHGCYEGAYYLAGYAIECALKACIAKQIKRYDFPDKKLTNDSYSHNLTTLAKLAGLERKLEEKLRSTPAFGAKWGVVKDWSEESRYRTGISEKLAKALYSAIASADSGVLPWLKKRW